MKVELYLSKTNYIYKKINGQWFFYSFIHNDWFIKNVHADTYLTIMPPVLAILYEDL